jgi:hypothetical protein
MTNAVKAKFIRIVQLLLILTVECSVLLSHAAQDKVLNEISEEKGQFSCLSPAEAQLFDLINQYRLRSGLPVIPNSRSLNKVARMHAVDLNRYSPQKAVDSRGLPCTLHSWSAKGFWTPLCYTPDHYYSGGMLIKPGEITNQTYDYPAYENVYWSSIDTIFPRRVMQAWEASARHRELVLEKSKWSGSYWKAFGVGIYKNIATIWFGSMSDPLGSMKACDVKTDHSPASD